MTDVVIAIGGSVAAALTAAGHQVVIMDRTGDVPVDLGDEGQVRAAAQRVPGSARTFVPRHSWNV